MLYRVPGDPKTGYDSGHRYGDVRWVRTVGTYTGTGTMRVRCGYGTGTVRGYQHAFSVGTVGTLYQYAVPTDRTHVPYPRTVPIPYPYPKARTYIPYPYPKALYPRTVPYLTPLSMYTVPPRDAQIENLIS